jgi:AAA15 family ATPase/GTPase
MRITEFTIRNFKSFGSHTNITTDKVRGLTQLNMLYGYNNSGKSNIIKFIDLIFQPKSRTLRINVEDLGQQSREITTPFSEGIISNAPFIFHKNQRNLPIEFQFVIQCTHDELKKKIDYKFKELKKEYFSKTHEYATFAFTGKIVTLDKFGTSEINLSEAKLNSKRIFEIGTNEKLLYFHTDRSDKLKNDKRLFENVCQMFTRLTHFMDNDRDLNVGAFKTSSVLESTSINFKEWLYDLYLNPSTYDSFIELIKFIKTNKVTFDSTDSDLFKNVEQHSPLGNNFIPEFSKKHNDGIELMLKAGKERFPISSFGTGIQQIIYILSSIFASGSRILLIEELEMNLSPNYQKKLLKILAKLIEKKVIDQVFFTTHSSHLSHRNDFSIYEVQMNSGKSTIKKTNPNSTPYRKFFKLPD